MNKINSIFTMMAMLSSTAFLSQALESGDPIKTVVPPAAPPAPVLNEQSQVTPLKVRVKDWGSKFEAVEAVFAKASQAKADIAEFRQKYGQLYKEEALKEKPDYVTLSQQLTEEFKTWLDRAVTRLVSEMGAAPVQFSVVTMGSMARGEGNFYSDFEFGFILEKKTLESMKYFTKLSQKLSDYMFLLGEHPITGNMGVHMDGADHAPFRNAFFYRYADPSWAKKVGKFQPHEFMNPYELDFGHFCLR